MHYHLPAMFIDGEWIHEAATTIPVVNPATEEVLAHLPCATAEDLERALAASARGFDTWRNTAPEKRSEIIAEGVRLLRQRADEIAHTLTLEQGKPIAQSKGEVLRAGDFFEWDADEGRRAYGRIIPGPTGMRHMVVRQPIGPVAVFTPWNFPATIVARKLGAVLASGCSAVLKPSAETPATACAIVKCFEDAGLPKGVINIVHGDPNRISNHLVASPIIRLVTLTGSTAVGRQLATLASAHLKPAVMELGGHAPVLVCSDTDPVKAAHVLATTKYKNAGQICVAPTRFFVHDSVSEPFTEAYVNAVRAIKVGNGLDASVHMGPMANARRVQTMERLVSNAVTSGATLLSGGNRISNLGFFFEPTVLADVPDSAAIMSEEPFGPVTPIKRFSELDTAIAAANSLPYGLAAYAFTESLQTAYELSERIDAGLLSINHTGAGLPEAPFGGMKDSGYGREGGQESLDAYMISKFVSQRASVR